MRCPKCKNDIRKDADFCPICKFQFPRLSGKCSICGKNTGTNFCGEREICDKCRIDLVEKVNISTTFPVDLDKSRIVGVDSQFVVIGTGILSEIKSQVNDGLGNRSVNFEEKLDQAKEEAIEKLKMSCIAFGGDSVIGFSLTLAPFSENRMTVIVTGTFIQNSSN